MITIEKAQKREKMALFDKRFAYLASVLEEDQDPAIFEASKTLLLAVFDQITFDSYPDIGVDDSGRAIAEWHNYRDYTAISIIPLSADHIVFEGMKTNRTVFTITTSITNLKKNRNRELFVELTHHALSA